MSAPRSWDVFCRVVDNFGDAAVCWRLARALARLPGGPRVRLWIDELQVLAALLPDIDPDRGAQQHAGIQVCRLVDEPFFGTPADVAVDGFGAGLPEIYAYAMAERRPRSLWIVLEYLSAEPWVAGHHGLPSPHPHLPLARYFFFPGFGPGTGGLLKEPELAARRNGFLADPLQRAAFWEHAGFVPPADGTRVVSVFGYEHAPLERLLEAWTNGREAVIAAVPAGRLSGTVAAFMQGGSAAVSERPAPTPESGGGTDPMPPQSETFVLSGQSLQRGALEARFLPFLSQERYDELLWTADWNFVRGEDSFVRAQWAQRPFLWQLYPQAGQAHLAKLEAFLELYCGGLEPALAASLRTLYRAWNGTPGLETGELVAVWSVLAANREALRAHARAWATFAQSGGDLAMNLADFCDAHVE